MDCQPEEGGKMSDELERRRSTDPLIQDLVNEVKGFRNDMKPIREFMEQVSAAKTAAIWIVGIIAAIGASITWAINLRDHIKH